MSALHDLAQLGQSIWYDFISRSLLGSGEFQSLIRKGLRGVTSNPSILEKAIAGGTEYQEDLLRLASEGKTIEEIYECLVLDDIGRAADILRPVYDQTQGLDGYVSLEVSPRLAYQTDATIADAKRLYAALDRPNIMIKVPATREGIPAIAALIGVGININATLLFSLADYDAVAGAYIEGLEQLQANGKDLAGVSSVASIFVSRLDTVIDRQLKQIDSVEAEALLGKVAIANAKAAYTRFEEIFAGDRWQRLSSEGARVQRPLWASTGTKNPDYPDTMYLDGLIGEHTVNTVPPATLDAFLDHGTVAPTIKDDLEQAQEELRQLSALGIDLDAATLKLQTDGVEAFSASFDGLLSSIRERMGAAPSEV